MDDLLEVKRAINHNKLQKRYWEKCLMCCVKVSVYYYYKAVDGVCVVNINQGKASLFV